MDDTMRKVAMAIELVAELEKARELARKNLRSEEDWFKDSDDADQVRRIEVIKECNINYKILQVIDHLLDGDGRLYRRLYDDLKTC